MKSIVITGSIASGKSTVSRYLQDLGYRLVDTDLVARQVLEPGSPGLQAVVAHFGPEILKEDGSLDRQYLGNLVFNNEEDRLALNAISHPLIAQACWQAYEEAKSQGLDLIFFDVPLYYEVEFKIPADQVWMVYVDGQTQLARLMERNQLTIEEAQSRISSQMPVEKKKGLADRVIDNRASREETYRQLDHLLKELEASQ